MGWHLTDLTAATGAPLPEVWPPKGYAFEAQGTQHVIYIDPSENIHELWWNSNGWHHNDLTAETGAPLALGADLVAYAFEAQGTQHVFYVAADQHIHELWWNWSGWHHHDLNAATGAPPGGAVTAYAFEAQGTQHVFYSNGHIQELWWDSNGWHHNDLTAATGAPLPGSGPRAYIFPAQGTQHVVYRQWEFDPHIIYELWWDDNGWHYADLIAATGAPHAESNPVGYVFNAQGTQHVVYWAEDEHVHELWWDSNGWHHNDLTTAANAPGEDLFNQPFGYASDAQGTQHVVYGTREGVIRELWWDSNGWHYDDLTAAVSDPILPTEPAGYVFNAQGTQHVIYVQRYSESELHVFELRGKPDLFFPSKPHPIHHPSAIPPHLPHPPDPGRF